MRTFTLLLCLANVMLLALWLQGRHDQAPRVLVTEIQGERVRLIRAQALASWPSRAKPESASVAAVTPAMPALASNQAVSVAPVASTCFRWGSFKPLQVNTVLQWLQPLHVNTRVVNLNRDSVEKRYWLYKPPLPNHEAAQAKLEELQQLGIEDAFVVQSPQYRNAISLGMFRDPQLADQWQQTLIEKGVNGVVKAVRYAGAGQVQLQLTGVDAVLRSQLKNGLALFPDSELTEMPCLSQ